MPNNRLGRGFVALAASAITAVYVAGYVHTQAADATREISSTASPLAAGPPDSPSPTSVVEAATSTPQTLAGSSPTASAASITDQAVEQFANANHVSWDEARAQMEAAAGITRQPTQEIPTATVVVRGQAPAATAAATQPRPVATPTTVVRAVPVPTRTAAPAVVAGFKDGTYSGAGTSRRGDVQVSLSIQGGHIASVNITGATTQYPTRFIAGLPGQVVSRQSAQIDTVSGATFSSLAFRAAVQQALQRAQA